MPWLIKLPLATGSAGMAMSQPFSCNSLNISALTQVVKSISSSTNSGSSIINIMKSCVPTMTAAMVKGPAISPNKYLRSPIIAFIFLH